MIRKSLAIEFDWPSLKEKLIEFAEGEGMTVDTIDGVRMESKGLWALVRPSKTEFKVRLVVEGEDRGDVSKLLEDLVSIIKS